MSFGFNASLVYGNSLIISFMISYSGYHIKVYQPTNSVISRQSYFYLGHLVTSGIYPKDDSNDILCCCLLISMPHCVCRNSLIIYSMISYSGYHIEVYQPTNLPNRKHIYFYLGRLVTSGIDNKR